MRSICRLCGLLGLAGMAQTLLSGCGSSKWSDINDPPEIQLFTINGQQINDKGQLATRDLTQQQTVVAVEPGREAKCVCIALDPDREKVTYEWSTSPPPEGQSGATTTDTTAPAGGGQTFLWSTPKTECVAYVSCTVRDVHGNVASRTARVNVDEAIENKPPTASLSPASVTLKGGEKREFVCTAADPENATLTYTFEPARAFAADTNTGPVREYTAPLDPGDYLVYCIVSDGRNSATASATVTVTAANQPPTASLSPASVTLKGGEKREFVCDAMDPDGDALTYVFYPQSRFAADPNNAPKREYTAPSELGTYSVRCVVSDGKNKVTASATVTVQ